MVESAEAENVDKGNTLRKIAQRSPFSVDFPEKVARATCGYRTMNVTKTLIKW